MFKFIRKIYSINAPVDGEVINLSQVPDQIFSNKMAGEGVAIIPSSNIFTAPVNGLVNSIFSTNHGFTITMSNGVTILVHIGLDTLELNGKGFYRLVEIGSIVKAGTPIIKVGESIITDKKYSFITPVVITNPEKTRNIECVEDSFVKSSCDKIISYKLR